MQDLENDMDDLFQRAAENYPLKNQKGNWDSVAKKITVEDDADEATVVTMPKKSNKIILFFIILFMLLAGGVMYYMFTGGAFKSNDLLAKKNNKKSYSAQLNNIAMENKVDAGGVNHYQSIPYSNEQKNQNKNLRPPNKNFSNNAISESTGSTSFPENDNVTRSIENASADNPKIEKSNEDNVAVATNKSLNKKTNDEILLLSKQENERLNIQKKEHDTSAIAEKNVRKKIANQKKKGFYIGILAGIDFSKVAPGSFYNTGFGAGALLGFRINKTLSFETGFLWNKKYYKSDGKYFSMNKIRSSMPAGMIINNLQSESSLIEIPLKAKFDLIRKTKSNVFVSGGVSSYIMTMEKNVYNVTVNGNLEKVSGAYGKPNYGFATIVNFSVGYEHNISRTLNIRTEPFIKIPLQGIGVGNLPVTSAGIQISITGHLN